MSEDKEPFEITDDSTAAWAMRKLRGLHQQIEAARKTAEDETARVQDWLERQTEKIERDAQYFENLLIHYAIEQRQNADRKTIDLPTGRVSSRASHESWNIDKESFIKWAKDFAPNLVRIKTTEMPETVEVLEEHLVAADGKVVVKETGEIVDGIEIKDATINYKVEVDK